MTPQVPASIAARIDPRGDPRALRRDLRRFYAFRLLAPGGRVARRVEAFEPDAVHIATEAAARRVHVPMAALVSRACVSRDGRDARG